ncbi:MAG TPA: bestrophin family ion channel [Enhygromyxa sp.]|nr:bestrophin family ion channel [Enhygromyxa sp.]
MFVTYRGSVIGLLTWQWRALLLFTIASTTVVVLEHFVPAVVRAIELPVAPVAVVGGAIGIFVSFRTNSAYDRWWEGRKLWGQLINSSRHFASQVLCYLPSELHGPLVRRHIAYVHALRVLLRDQSLAADQEFLAQLPREEAERAMAESNPTHALLHMQLEALSEENRAGRLDNHRMQSFDLTIRALLDVQGGCERIKKTPFPRGYGFIADRLIQAYGVLLPLALVTGLGNDWVAIPLTILVCLSFALISEVGRVLEDPFTMFWPALPLSAMATTIEINLRQRLGDRDLPAAPKPNARGILM